MLPYCWKRLTIKYHLTTVTLTQFLVLRCDCFGKQTPASATRLLRKSVVMPSVHLGLPRIILIRDRNSVPIPPLRRSYGKRANNFNFEKECLIVFNGFNVLGHKVHLTHYHSIKNHHLGRSTGIWKEKWTKFLQLRFIRVTVCFIVPLFTRRDAGNPIITHTEHRL